MLQSNYAEGKAIAPTPAGAGVVCAYRAEIALKAADLTLGRIIEMGPLPDSCDLVDAILDADQLDADEGAITLDVGIMSGEAGGIDDTRTCGNELFGGSNVAQDGGVVRAGAASAFRLARRAIDRGIGVKVTAAPAAARDGTIGLTIFYRG